MEIASRKKILIIEDDPTLAGGLCDALEFEGFLAIHSKTGKDGLARARLDQPDCIILDLMLPVLTAIKSAKSCDEWLISRLLLC